METLEQRIRRVVQEDVVIVPYDPAWPEWFRRGWEETGPTGPRFRPPPHRRATTGGGA